MDLLSQYNKDHPEAFQEKKPLPLTDEYGREYSGMIALVMRSSGGRIRDARMAAQVLLIAGAVVFAVSMVIFIYGFSGSGAPENPAEGIDQRQFSNEQ